MATSKAIEDEDSLQAQLEIASKRLAELKETRDNNAEIVKRLKKELTDATADALRTWVVLCDHPSKFGILDGQTYLTIVDL